MAHIQKKIGARGQVRWEVRWTERTRDAAGSTSDVRHRQRSFRTKKEADQFKPLHEADTLRGTVRDYDAAAQPLSYFAESWLRTLTDLKPRTVDGYREIYAKHVALTFGHLPVGDIRTTTVREWRQARLAAGVTTARMRHAEGVLRRVLDLAVEDNALAANPAVRRRRDRRTLSAAAAVLQKAVFLNESQVEALGRALDDRAPYGLMVRFLAWTGLRAGELAGLNVADVHLRWGRTGWRGYVDVHRTRRKVKGGWQVDTPKSEQSTRRVDLQDWLAEDLHRYLAEDHPHGDDPTAPLWPGRRLGGYTHGNRTGRADAHAALNWNEPVEPGSVYKNVYKPALAAAGLPERTRLHDLRHTYASLALSRGAAPLWVSEQMGHSSYKITLDVYAHYIPKDDIHPLNGRPRPSSAYGAGRNEPDAGSAVVSFAR